MTKEICTIMVLGDSIARGVVHDEDKGRYVFSKRGFVPALSKRVAPNVVDYSKFGATTSHGIELLNKHLESDNPDIVFIEYGSNDCDYKWDEVAKNPKETHLPNLSLEQYIQNIKTMVHTVRDADKTPILTNLHPLSDERYFCWFTDNDEKKQQSTLIWLQDVARIYYWQEMYSYALERTAAELSVSLINIRGAFLRQKNYLDFLCMDGIHPNERGQQLIETIIYASIEEYAPSILLQG